MPRSNEDPANMPPGSTSRTPDVKNDLPKPNGPHRIHAAPTDFARSSLANWIPPVAVTPENEVLGILKREWQARSENLPAEEGYDPKRPMIIADLYDFEVYQTPRANSDRRDFELICLHYMDVPHQKQLSLNGFLCLGSVNIYVEGVPVHRCSIEGYGDDESPEVTVYLQTNMASRDKTSDIWFRVKRPSQYYKRFHEPFLGVAQFTKHTLDYMEEMPPKTVSLANFRQDFIPWVFRRYPQNRRLQAWHALLNDRADLRVDVVAYILFLHREAHGLPNAQVLLAHPLWKECIIVGNNSQLFKKQIKSIDNTVATPHVHKCWSHLYFGEVMEAMPISPGVQALQHRRKRALGFAETVSTGSYKQPHCQPYGTSQIRVGDVVSFYPNEQDTGKWKGTKAAKIAKLVKSAETEWFAYVQGTQIMKDGNQKLEVVWMYQPQDTTISIAKYTFPNELFFSDHCNCGDPKLLSSQIRGKHSIDWCPQIVNQDTGFFVRQTYLTDNSFVTFKYEHKTCACKRGTGLNSEQCRLGDTVYIKRRINGQEVLNPVVIQGFNSTRSHATFRILLRLRLDCADLAEEVGRTGNLTENELVLTNDYEYLPVSRIQRRCHIHFFKRGDGIPVPYNRGGAGDLWFISMGIVTRDGHRRLKYLSRLPERFNEGDDMTALPGLEKLVGLALFSGGGSFDRGLEEGGAVDFQYSVDMAPWAVHTQYANAGDPSKLCLYYGSVDDYLKAALSGGANKLVARVGEVTFIAAGSPCPAFSSLQQRPLERPSLINASHITTLCSAVDLYRPKYAVLENVVAMSHTKTGREDQNILSYLVACFISMGYQVNQYIMDSWNYGSGQHRSRVLVSIAAPGMEPVVQPKHTHSRTFVQEAATSLGELANGERFGQREAYTTPFASLTAGKITSDLPNIGNGNVHTCLSHPDHRASRPPNRRDRARIRSIPRHPPGCGYAYAYKRGMIPPSLEVRGKEKGKAFTRIEEYGLIPTICTALSIQDSQNGANIHWSQDRPITILEARRAQGYMDDEPIIGETGQQFTVVGNGVDRKVALAQGLALRSALLKNSRKNGQDMLVDVESEEEALSDATEDFLIDVYVPPPSTSGLPAQQSRAETDHSDDYASATDELANGGPRLDGSSDLRDSLSALAVPKVLDRMSATVTRALNGLSLRSRQSIPVSATTALSKWGRDEEFTRVEDSIGNTSDEESVPGKRIRAGATSESASTERDVNEVRANEEQSRTKMRRTRHSGLSIAFTPQQWDQRPEREYSTDAS